ncbi:RagB/SusD family nutrient uptake outer membrane protein [Carboxylicivirga sediminis]|uniref:RagB/SusD family nutrient uptake outer membrane protein n=1 Tax=Carboxylicivirga sediminis TaxID=2006564 RepID=A0A941F3K5_9BACT|nr:RagB/SusD family nutrient uptake outer membrane protein [Carboxylicivirga sediminis]MBR8536148.1 RagB/SusD family nutrient uptake outer membrane protein [Carboxylicivirga sediminis]
MIRNIILSIFLVTLFTGCDDFLDYTEHSFYDDPETIFSTYNRTRQFLADIYSTLPSDYDYDGIKKDEANQAMRSAATDEAEYVKQNHDVQKFTNGQWSAFNALDNNWSKYYTGIRSVNLFLDQIDGRTFDDYKYNEDYEEEQERYDKFQYEARFLRAFFYFELAKRYGDIPMPEGVVNDVDAINNIQRSSFEDVIDYIVSECDAISEELPVTWSNQVFVETGRVTRGAVYALKARALLYAASPLHNTSGDVTKWEAAATAANAFLINPDFAYGFDAQYYNSSDMAKGSFNNRTSAELIFERREENSNAFEKANFPMGFEGANGNATCPSQNLVDAYQTTDGYDVILNNGVWSAPGSSVFDPANPYENRDPRLKQTIIVNGSTWKSTTVETFKDGANGLPLADATPTGYYLKKYVREDITIAGSNTNTKEHAWVIFRLSEVYLNLAEALNEAYGPTGAPAGFAMDATTALNMVRTRAAVALPAVSGLSQAELRAAIIRERQVELAFEDHRFWDVRRWRLFDSSNPDNVTEDIYGIDITNNGGALSYSKKLVDDRLWDEKMYLYPIPYNETTINTNLGQNPGW